MRKLDYYWMSNPDWWEFDGLVPVVKKNAPKEAQDSYKRYVELLK